MHCDSSPTQSPVTQDGTAEITQWTQLGPPSENGWPGLTLPRRSLKTESLLWILVTRNWEQSTEPPSSLHWDSGSPLRLCVSTGPTWGLQVSTLLGQHSCQNLSRGFPGCSVVKYPPANTRVTGSIPDLGRSHLLWKDWACALEPGSHKCWACTSYSLCSTTEATAMRKPVHRDGDGPRSLQLEKGPQPSTAKKWNKQQKNTTVQTYM